MANRQTHLDIAIAAGLLLALFVARGHTPSALLAEIVGVVGGSALGGLMPDAFEPTISSWHRKSFHSVLALAGASSLTEPAGAAHRVAGGSTPAGPSTPGTTGAVARKAS